MPNTYASLTVHAVFATKRREPTIHALALARLPHYVDGILTQLGCVCLAAGGFHDHLHLVVGYPPRIAVASILKHAKGGSAAWLRKTFDEMRGFAWQDGYAAFTVSRSQVDSAAAYLRQQKTHHARRDFQAEFLELLEKHGVEYDPRYLWD